MTRTRTYASLEPYHDAGNSACTACLKRIFSAENRRELFYNVTNPKEELLGDVFELALGMLTLAMRHPEKFDNLGTFHDMNACIQGLECSVYRNCASESIELMSADSPRKRSPPRRIAEIERYSSEMAASSPTTRFLIQG